MPLLILWFGIGEESKIILIAIGAFFPVYTIVGSALRHVDQHLLEAGRAFGLRGLRLFTAVQLPAVVPSAVSALRLALAQSWLFLVAAELIASSMGLGFLLLDSGQNGRIDRIFLAIISLALLGSSPTRFWACSRSGRSPSGRDDQPAAKASRGRRQV